MELRKYVMAVTAVPIVLLLMGPQAQACWGDGFRFGNGDGFAVKKDGAEVDQGITQASLMPNQSFNPTLDILRIRRIVVIHGSINKPSQMVIGTNGTSYGNNNRIAIKNCRTM